MSTDTEVVADAKPRSTKTPAWLVWVLVIVVVVVGSGALVAGLARGPRPMPFDPNNRGPMGTRALDQVLQSQGVETHRARTRADIRRLKPDADTTVVITTDPQNAAAEDIAPVLQQAGRVVVLMPSDNGLDLPFARGAASDMNRECRTDVVPRPVPRVQRQMVTYEATDPTWTGCYGPPGEEGLITGSWGNAEVVVVGTTDIVTNQFIAEADHAQLGLWLTGAHERLIWYNADINDQPKDTSRDRNDDAGPSIVPEWFYPAVWLLLCTVPIAMFVVGRRFGPLSREPLPVVVPAMETVRARAHLYRSFGSRDHAMEALRSATCRRLCRRLGLPVSTSPTDLAQHLRTAHPQAPDLLTGPYPTNDRDALDWADALRTLEREVYIR